MGTAPMDLDALRVMLAAMGVELAAPAPREQRIESAFITGQSMLQAHLAVPEGSVVPVTLLQLKAPRGEPYGLDDLRVTRPGIPRSGR